MQPDPPKPPLTDQQWFVDLLAVKGFFRTSPSTFSNGKTSIQVDGTRLKADPGTGDDVWITQSKWINLSATVIKMLQSFVERLPGNAARNAKPPALNPIW